MQNNSTAIKKSVVTKDEKYAIFLLSAGVFLEYFDLMLYVHMITVLNKLFFPPNFSASNFASAAGFCSTYLLRPVGALLFGYLGDKMGRKLVVILSTMMMAIACCMIALLPTYAQIGITASIIVTFARMLQGVSATGEMQASEIYLSELIAHPFKVPAVALLSVGCLAGGTCALILSFLLIKDEFLWRWAFLVGAAVALIGFKARMSMRESKLFVQAREDRARLAAMTTASKMEKKEILSLKTVKGVSDQAKTLWYFSVMTTAQIICFYFGLVYANEIMASKFGYSPVQVIEHNLVVVLGQLLAYSCFALLSYRINPIKIFKFRTYGFAIFVCSCPLIFKDMTNPLVLMIAQIATLTLSASSVPMDPVIYSHFPILSRMKSALLISTTTKMLMVIFGSFGIAYLMKKYENWGFFLLAMPITIGLIFAIRHFEHMEEKAGEGTTTYFYQKKKHL